MPIHDADSRDTIGVTGRLQKLHDAFFRQGWALSFLPFPEGADLCPRPVLWTCPYSGLTVSPAGGEAGRLLVDFPDLVRAEVVRRDRTVRVFPLVPGLSSSTLEHFVMDILFPRLIAETGALVVHGALIAGGTGSVCLIGDSGRGKSTLSAALRGAGWRLQGDDALEVRIDGVGIAARATYPSLRLHPDSLEQLFPEPPQGLSPVADYLDKVRLDPGDPADPAEPTRLRAVFLLDRETGPDEVSVRPLSASTLCMALVRQSFALDPADPVAARGRLAAAGAVAAAVPGFSLSYPRDYARLPEVTGLVRSTLDGVGATARQEMAAASALPRQT